MWTKVLIIVLMLIILFSLVSAGFYLIRDKDDKKRLVKALTWRIALSVTLFIFLFVAFAMGWLSPHGV